MQQEKFEELEDRASQLHERDQKELIKKLEAKSRVHQVSEQMKVEGKAHTLTDEEEKMLLAFREFKKSIKIGVKEFTWETANYTQKLIIQES